MILTNIININIIIIIIIIISNIISNIIINVCVCNNVLMCMCIWIN